VLKAFYGDIFPPGPNGENLVTPEMIRGQVNFTMTVLSEMVNKDAKVNQMISYFSVFQTVLSSYSKETIAKQVWELEGFDGDQIHVNPPMPAAPPMGGLPGGAPPAMASLGPKGGLPVGVPSNSVPMTPNQGAAAGAAILKQAGQGSVKLPGAPNTAIPGV
jgi:hypothetical protein